MIKKSIVVLASVGALVIGVANAATPMGTNKNNVTAATNSTAGTTASSDVSDDVTNNDTSGSDVDSDSNGDNSEDY